MSADPLSADRGSADPLSAYHGVNLGMINSNENVNEREKKEGLNCHGHKFSRT